MLDALDLCIPGGDNETPWRADTQQLYLQLMLDLPLKPRVKSVQVKTMTRKAAAGEVHASGLSKKGSLVLEKQKSGNGQPNCNYSQLIRKINVWVKVASEKLAAMSTSLESKMAAEKEVKAKEEATKEETKMKREVGTCTTPNPESEKPVVKVEPEEVNEYGTRIVKKEVKAPDENADKRETVTVKQEPDTGSSDNKENEVGNKSAGNRAAETGGQMTAIKPRVEYKVGTVSGPGAGRRGGVTLSRGAMDFSGQGATGAAAGAKPRVMGTIKQDLEGNIVNKPVGMYSIVQRLKSDPAEMQSLAQNEELLRRTREAEEETRRGTWRFISEIQVSSVVIYLFSFGILKGSFLHNVCRK